MAQYHKGLCHFGEREPSLHVGDLLGKGSVATIENAGFRLCNRFIFLQLRRGVLVFTFHGSLGYLPSYMCI
jgi:hypothetical protein